MLNVIIVGTGLAGLTAARILREHHNVTCYERGDVGVATGGQGIMIAPNGVKILESLGYQPHRAGAVPIHGIRFYDKQDKLTKDIAMDLKPLFGADYMSQKRSDFREELLQLATSASSDLGIKGLPAKITFNTSVIDLEPEGGVITLSDGSTATADVVIGGFDQSKRSSFERNNSNITAVCDGVHFRLRDIVLNDVTYVAKKTGLPCFRLAVSTEDAKKVLGDLPLPHWWEPSTCQNRSSLISAGDGTARMVTAYPMRDQTMYNLSCIVRTDDSNKPTVESWHADGDPAKMVEIFGDFSESLRKILR
jgi:salicylate hydroxylase